MQVCAAAKHAAWAYACTASQSCRRSATAQLPTAGRMQPPTMLCTAALQVSLNGTMLLASLLQAGGQSAGQVCASGSSSIRSQLTKTTGCWADALVYTTQQHLSCKPAGELKDGETGGAAAAGSAHSCSVGGWVAAQQLCWLVAAD